MPLYCDNFTICRSFVMDLATVEQTETRARVRGWHIFHGSTYGGEPHDHILCPVCVGPSHRGVSSPTKPLTGQGELFAA